MSKTRKMTRPKHSTLIVITITLLLLGCIYSHNCIHNEIAHHPKVVANQATALQYKNGMNRKLQETTNWNNIRIQFHFDNVLNDLPKRTCYKVGDEVQVGEPASASVKCSQTVTNNCWDVCTKDWVVTENMSNYMSSKVIKSLKDDLEKMLLVQRLADTVTVPANACNLDSEYKIPESLVNNGIDASQTDLVVLVHLRPRRNNAGFALFCKQGPSGRPVLGILNLNPSNVFMDGDNYNIVRHEITHILAFSPLLYDSFRDENGALRTNVRSTVRKTFSSSTGVVQKDIYKLNTPGVTKFVQDHFGCDSADGAFLEEYGTGNTVGAHWEMTHFMNELMTGSNEYIYNTRYAATYSNLTLALLEDSGWYKIASYEKSLPLIWGRNTGCDIITKRCENWSLGQRAGYFCPQTDNSVEFCNFEHTNVGGCGIVEYSQALGYYEHLSNPVLGGRGLMQDVCPLVRAQTDCRNPSSPRRKNYGEVYGSQSGCFHSNASPTASGTGQAARCLQYECSTADTQLIIKIGSQKIKCPQDQSYLRVTLSSGLAGYVDCPQDGYDLLCGPNKVPNIPSYSAATSIVAQNNHHIIIACVLLVFSTFIFML